MSESFLASRGSWCWPSGVFGYQHGFYLFRRSFDLSSPRTLVAYVCADCRYKLYLDGDLVSFGPVKSPVTYKQLSRVELEVGAGSHVLSAEVIVWPRPTWNMASMPYSEMQWGGGFYFSCKDGDFDLSTPTGWKAVLDPSRRILGDAEETLPPNRFGVFSMTREETDLEKSLGGWMLPGFDDSSWLDNEIVENPIPNVIGYRLNDDCGTFWMMEMPSLKPMLRTASVAGVLDPGETGLAVQADGSVRGTLPAGHSEATLTYARYFTGFLATSGSGGKGVIRLWQSERTNALMLADVLRSAGHPWRTETFDIRSAGILKIVSDLESPQEFVLESFFCTYDFGPFKEFHSSDKELERIYEVGIHTALCCAHDTYEDCPFYERYQYVGDTRIQALISYEGTGCGELGRKAILDFQRSQGVNGLTQSRFPSCLPQYIPGYSLFWILMIEDYLRYFPDSGFRHSLIRGIEGVVEYYASLVDHATGLAGHPGFWGFTDWTDDWGGGDPSRDKKSPTAIENLLFACALQSAAGLARQDGNEYFARRWMKMRRDILDAVNKHLFDRERGLYIDVPGHDWISRHAQALAVIAGAVSEEFLPSVHRALLEKIPGLTECSLYFQFYVMEALRLLGDTQGVLEAMAPWRECLRKSPWLTTFPEVPDADRARSMCHAWSASPVYFLGSKDKEYRKYRYYAEQE